MSTASGTFGALRIPNFRYLWWGQLCHAAALWMEQIARPFLVLALDGGAVHVGGVIAVRVLPQVVLGAFAGVIADSFDRRRVLLLDKSAILALNVAFAAVLLLGRIELWHIYAYGMLRGAMMAFDQPARQSMIPRIVPLERVTNAMALLSATQNTMRIAGALFGGLIYGLLGAEGAFVGIALVYSGALYATWRLDVPHEPSAEPTTARSIGVRLVEGVRYGLQDPTIRGVLILTLVYFSFCMSFVSVFVPLFAEQVLDIGPMGAAGVLSLAGAGALSASMLIARFSPTGLARILPLCVIASGTGLVGFAAATFAGTLRGLALAGLAALAIGGIQTSFLSLSRSLMLQTARPEMHGRVLGLLAFDRAFLTLGASSAGFLAAWIGAQWAQIAFGLAAIAVGGAVWLARLAWDARAPEEPARTAAGRPEVEVAEPAASGSEQPGAPGIAYARRTR